ncbi:MAG TPA: hypothetical protein VFB13_17930 [Reyranella sp.]|nr:hypothetical protein [Reyranella sp.]
MLLSSCDRPSPHVQLAVPQPSEAQLQGCPDPKLSPPGTADDQALQIDKTEIANWGACYYDRFWSLVGWVRRELMDHRK